MRRNIFPVLIALLAILPSAAMAADRDKWVEARSPHFIVVCNAGEGPARKTAIQFEQIRSLYRESLPYANSHVSPLITILAVKDEHSLSELLPEYWAEKGHTHPAGIFLTRFYQYQVAVNLEAHGENPFEATYHEYYHSLTVPYFPGLPVWVAEGMADFYGNTEIGDRDANLGMANNGLLYELQNSSWIPLATLFKVDHSSPYYNEQKKVSVFYAESWAMIHYLMLGDREAHRQMFRAYLDEIGRGTPPDAAAAKVFGDLGKLQKMLENYVRGSSFYQIKVQSPPKIAESELHLRPLSDAEADAYRGGFLSMHEQFEVAMPLLQEATRLDPKLSLTQQNLALLHYFHNEPGEAVAAASAAIDLDPGNATTRYLRAMFKFNASESREDPQIEEDLRQAIAANPDFAPSYGLIAVFLANINQKLPEALSMAQRAVSIEPGNANFVLAQAQVLARLRRFNEAESQARRARPMATDPQTQQEVDRFTAYLGQAREYDAAAQQRQAAASTRPSTPISEARVDPNSETNPATKTSDSPRADEAEIVLHRRDEATAGTRSGTTLEGVVTQVRCTGKEIWVSLALAPGVAPLVLHAPDWTAVDYTSDIRSGQSDPHPCDELKGHTTKILFTPSFGQDVDGEITRAEVEK